ncbi:MAG: prolyl oligopeptidase family serine peptidase [Bacteroidales bacterium]|nr:prolyl oligopeptidase family serine peptidase [Bacteroidales bacterium]
MNKIINALVALAFLFPILTNAQDNGKKALDQSVYEDWKRLQHPGISNDGEWIVYEINPQKGDGMLHIKSSDGSFHDSIPRGYQAEFSPASNYVTFKIKPQHDTVRQAKLDKVKKEKRPKDSLGIYMLEDKQLTKYKRVKSFKVAEEESDWMVIKFYKDLPAQADTTQTEEDSEEEEEEKKEEAEIDSDGTRLMVMNPVSGEKHEFEHVVEYTFSKNGQLAGFISATKDSVGDSTAVHTFNTRKQDHQVALASMGKADGVSADEQGEKLGFMYTSDTTEAKIYNLYYWNDPKSTVSLIVDTMDRAMPNGWSVSKHGRLGFSKSGDRLFFGIAPKPEPEPEDTLLKEEKARLDVWNWKDDLIQPHQLERLEKEKKRNYKAVYYFNQAKMVQLGDELVRNVITQPEGEGDIALGTTRVPYIKLLSWEASRYRDVYLIDMQTGKKKKILEKVQSYTRLSPEGDYVVWYAASDSSWNAYSIEEGTKRKLTEGLNVKFYNVEHDMPNEAGPYGYGGFTKNDKRVLIYDRWDIWKFDPRGKKDPVNLTAGYGREHQIRFRHIDLFPEQHYVGDNTLLYAFDEKTKASGYWRMDVDKSRVPERLLMQDYRFNRPEKAKDAAKVIWRKESFRQYPELWMSNLGFEDPQKQTVTNPQQDKYRWGTVELVHWTSFKGEELEGMLYRPENLDKSKKHPMLVYFYEKSSDRLNSHRIPSPSRSIINPSYCVSNGYMVFVPNITYETGYPGQSAYNAIVSGTMAMTERYDYIDKNKMGLQGQSWGGYQIAYLVTQTDLYAAAMAGAPVSNMTSAYGGIRWGSGMSRMFQYEESQSRIGGTLWEKPLRYIENSPIFHVPEIETPLLIMHNDDDGAVPWYQGIELFVAMRRLNKPAWMLQYNDEAHNLRRWPNRMDLDKRMMQFFDHFLKDQPAPVWLEKGLPAIKKGKTKGFELVD